jgi:predicted carbohydrate-binding protein with CBM5 and CBM33 domain
MENDANGNPIYVGYNKTANAGTAVASWFIVKITYDANQSPTRQQLPSFGVQFIGIWDSRTTYFV